MFDEEKWLGTESINCFENETEIREYFSRENLNRMWPESEISEGERLLALDSAIDLWNQK